MTEDRITTNAFPAETTEPLFFVHMHILVLATVQDLGFLHIYSLSFALQACLPGTGAVNKFLNVACYDDKIISMQ